MEVWILLAAAGSGYLARRWQNSQKGKGASAEGGNESAGSSGQRPPSRGRYRRFSSGKQAGKLFFGKGNPQWARHSFRSNSNAVAGSKSVRKKEDSRDTKSEEIQTSLGGGKSPDVGNVVEKLSSDCNSQENSSSVMPAGACKEGNYSADEHDSFLPRSRSGKRTSDSGSRNGVKSGNSGQQGGKRIKDAIDSTSIHGEAFMLGGTWMPGYWDSSLGAFVLDSDSLLVQQEGECRDKESNARKLRTPRKHGRSRGSTSRRKSLDSYKPMSSLESCLSAQLNTEYIPIGSLPLSSCSRKDTMKHSAGGFEMSGTGDYGGLTIEANVVLSDVDSAVGLPSLSRQPTVRNKMRARRNSSDRLSKVHAASKLLAGTKQHSAEMEDFWLKGLAGITWKGLIFNFGVGVGIMFTVISNMREVKRLTLLLREAEYLIKDLENELGGRVDVRVPPNSKDLVEQDEQLGQRQHVVANTLNKVRSASQILNSMRVSLTDDSMPELSVKHVQSTDMAKLEAELEAELERMELNLEDGNNSKGRRRHSGSSEHEADVAGSLLQGELTVKGLPFEADIESDEDEGSDSSHEDLHVTNYAVSPRELSSRLHEVLEARQEERIAELEAELKRIGSKLLAKEEQLQSSRTRDADVEDGSLQYYELLKESVKLEAFSSTLSQREKQLPSPIKHGLPGAGYPEGVAVVNVDNSLGRSSALFEKPPNTKGTTAFITLGGDALAAYNEACKEFSKVSNESTALGVGVEKNAYSGEVLEMVNAKDLDLHSGTSDNWEQVDLLSLAEDFCPGDGADFDKGLALFSDLSSKKKSFSRRRKSRNKGVAPCHPEPENVCIATKAMDSSDDTANDTSGSTPCSVKFMDVRTVGSCDHFAGKIESKRGEIEIPTFVNWNEEIPILAGANTPDHEQHFLNNEEASQRLSSALNQGGQTSAGNEDFVDLDDEVGQLLIKRIVEKSRKGSPIVQDAQTVLASFERNAGNTGVGPSFTVSKLNNE